MVNFNHQLNNLALDHPELRDYWLRCWTSDALTVGNYENWFNYSAFIVIDIYNLQLTIDCSSLGHTRFRVREAISQFSDIMFMVSYNDFSRFIIFTDKEKATDLIERLTDTFKRHELSVKGLALPPTAKPFHMWSDIGDAFIWLTELPATKPQVILNWL